MKKTELKKLLKAIRKFTEMDPQMSVLAVNAFLSAAIDEDVHTISDVRDILLRYGGTRSNVSATYQSGPKKDETSGRLSP